MYDALVIGAGPAGSTAARLLAQAGWAVALVEKSAYPRRKVCGEFISGTNFPLFRDAEIRESFLALAGPEIRRVGLFAGNAALNSPMPAAADSPALWGRALGREHLDLLLAQAAARAGATLWQPWKLVASGRANDHHVCRIEAEDGSTRELTARILVAATGSWERNAFSTLNGLRHRPSDLFAFKAHFANSRLPADLMPLLAFRGGYGGMVHTDGGRISLSCCIRRDVLARCRHEFRGLSAADAVLSHILASCKGVADALDGAVRDGGWLAAGPIRPGIRRGYDNGIFFTGNIAGEAHPVIAEGISMAIQSAWLLCRRLTANPNRTEPRALSEAGRLYAADWRRAFATRITSASIFAHLAMQPGAALAAPLFARLPGLLTLGARLSGKATQLAQ